MVELFCYCDHMWCMCMCPDQKESFQILIKFYAHLYVATGITDSALNNNIIKGLFGGGGHAGVLSPPPPPQLVYSIFNN